MMLSLVQRLARAFPALGLPSSVLGASDATPIADAEQQQQPPEKVSRKRLSRKTSAASSELSLSQMAVDDPIADAEQQQQPPEKVSRKRLSRKTSAASSELSLSQMAVDDPYLLLFESDAVSSHHMQCVASALQLAQDILHMRKPEPESCQESKAPLPPGAANPQAKPKVVAAVPVVLKRPACAPESSQPSAAIERDLEDFTIDLEDWMKPPDQSKGRKSWVIYEWPGKPERLSKSKPTIQVNL